MWIVVVMIDGVAIDREVAWECVFPRSVGSVMAHEGQSNLLLSHNHQALPHLVRHILHIWLSAGGKDV